MIENPRVSGYFKVSKCLLSKTKTSGKCILMGERHKTLLFIYLSHLSPVEDVSLIFNRYILVHMRRMPILYKKNTRTF
jgi:hypothetical protein